MKSKKNRRLKIIPSAVVALFIANGAVLKLLSLPSLVSVYAKIGLQDYLQVFGITELLFVALFLWHRTMRAGFLLLTGYFGGAMAVELANGVFFIFPAAILAAVWVASCIRDTSIFISLHPKQTATS